ncbi:MAG: hypothetical protein HYT07_00330 [Candidatus Levybacteria bacterium]|nr:hypothetical protein [Candidatus Levybacteria bacterium]
MEYLKGELLKTGNPSDSEYAKGIADMLRSRGADIPLPSEFRQFTDREKESLKNDGAIIYELNGETILDQMNKGRLFGYVARGGNRLLRVPSLRTQVAIYLDPEKFFISNSNKELLAQEKLAERDSQELRDKLGFDSLTVIIPNQASTLTELAFKHLDETGVWLFGRGYSYLYGRTNNPVNETGSNVAHVGNSNPSNGISIGYWPSRNGSRWVYVVRLIVAIR